MKYEIADKEKRRNEASTYFSASVAGDDSINQNTKKLN